MFSTGEPEPGSLNGTEFAVKATVREKRVSFGEVTKNESVRPFPDRASGVQWLKS